MATATWDVSIGATLFTSSVLSMSFDKGRQSMYDNFVGGHITITLRNNTNQCGVIAKDDAIYLNGVALYLVSNITFDEGILDAEATCTITGIDALSILASYSYSANSPSYPAISPTQQIFNVWDAYGLEPPYIDDVLPAASTTNTASGSDGTMLDYFNLLMAGEMGSFYVTHNSIQAIPYGYVKTSQATFGRSGTSGIPYYELQRDIGTSVSANRVIVDWVEGQSTYTTGFSTFVKSYTKYTSLAGQFGTSAQASNQAQFLGTLMIDPTTISGQLSFTDKAMSTTAYNNFFPWYTKCGSPCTLEYKIPGQTATSKRIYVEGISISVTPEVTDYTIYFSDGDFYDDYILDSASGVLGVTRFGWGL
jgi:hypothetical protein